MERLLSCFCCFKEHGDRAEGAVDSRRLPHDGRVSHQTAGDGSLPEQPDRHRLARQAHRRESTGTYMDKIIGGFFDESSLMVLLFGESSLVALLF